MEQITILKTIYGSKFKFLSLSSIPDLICVECFGYATHLLIDDLNEESKKIVANFKEKVDVPGAKE